jgi:hypothetical protein
MNDNKTQWGWVEKTTLTLENSFGLIDRQKNVAVRFTLGLHDGGETGWFEFYDTSTGGDLWYAEGMLWFERDKLVDYDGVFELPIQIVNKLKEIGYDVEDFID